LLWLVVAAAAAAAAIGAGAAVSARPSLVLVDIKPTVKVTGLHFRALERVRVTFKTDVASRSRWVRASRRGSFVADLGLLPASFDPCKGVFTIVARGRTGDQAIVRYVQRECPPPG